MVELYRIEPCRTVPNKTRKMFDRAVPEFLRLFDVF